jgi:hypothetical protein
VCSRESRTMPEVPDILLALFSASGVKGGRGQDENGAREREARRFRKARVEREFRFRAIALRLSPSH